MCRIDEEENQMEMYPGKQTFIDDFFIESMVGVHRVLNCPEKITIDEPLHTVNPDRPWESGTRARANHLRREKSHLPNLLSGCRLHGVRRGVQRWSSLGTSQFRGRRV